MFFNKSSNNLPYEKIGKEVRCIADEIPFEIPDSWEWVRLGNICNFGECINAEPGVIPDEAWVLDLEDIEKDTGRLIQIKTKKETKCTSTKHAFDAGQILYSKLRPYLNKVVIAPNSGFCTSEILPLRFYGDLFIPYVQRFLMSPGFVEYTIQCSYGVKMPRLGTEDGKAAFVPVPPLAEQKRIVAKIEELLPHIEEYGKAESKVYKLNAEFPEQLKKSILQWAIQGKLVPQNPEDEPASVLLERIRAEKAKLIKDGKIKKDKNESVIFRRDNSHYTLQGKNEVCIDDKIPFDLPDGWVWCNLQMVTTNIHYGYTASAAPTGNSKLLRITDIQNNAVNWEDVPFCTVTPNELEGYQLHNRDIMIARTGGTIGKTYIVRNLNETAVFASYLIRAIPVPHINEEYLKIFMESPFYWKQLKNFSSGTGQPNVNGNSLKNLLLPLPPLEEQERIVQFYFEFLPTVISLTEFSL